MNPILQTKLDELERARDYECWYLVKQPTDFDSLCYLVSFLADYKTKTVSGSLQDYVGQKISELKAVKPDIKMSNNYRALRVAAFFGLITMTSSKYDDALITDTFKEITDRCNGEYEKTEPYKDIIQRQIEKMFISSEIDEQRDDVRRNYRLYPVMLLYKVLIELGRVTGKYEISMTEYRYLVATTEKFEDFLDTLLLIKLLRDESDEVVGKLEQYKSKFDNRLILALKQLDTLEFDGESIRIKEDRVQEVAKKVFIFEENPNIFTTTNYLGFLGSTKSLFQLADFESQRNDDSIPTEKIGSSNNAFNAFQRNRIIFGAPGTGKSFTLNREKNALLGDGGEYERVTFHPDYSYANFVGTYKPVPCKDSDGKDAITYSYVPGPFMRTYVKALQNSRTDEPKPFLLVIEEINRANVAAVFGDVFQLLDRGDDEVSEYPIQVSEDIKKFLALPENLGGKPSDYAEIRIPDNMFIWATMNSADQGVFPMDTAFKRRWDFTYLGIDDSEAGIVGKKVILGQGEYQRVVEWNELRKAINNELLTYKVNEDKLMGPYFISKKNLPEGEMIDPAVFTRIFKNKVIMYLFDDAAKQKRATLFAGCEDKNKNLYSQICREFDSKGVFIFCDNISNQFIDKAPEDDGE